MKKIFFIILILSNFKILANNTINKADQNTVLNEIVGNLRQIDIDESRTFFFTDYDSHVVTLVNTNNNLTLFLENTNNYQSFYVSLANTLDTTTKVKSLNNKKSIEQSSYFDMSNKKEIYSLTTMNFNSTGTHPNLVLDLSASYISFFEYNQDGKQINLKDPMITNDKTQAHFVLSLTVNEIDALGLIAVKKINDDRQIKYSNCTLEVSGQLIRCDFALPTNYSDDTIHAIFSIKDAKASELLEISLEPGC